MRHARRLMRSSEEYHTVKIHRKRRRIVTIIINIIPVLELLLFNFDISTQFGDIETEHITSRAQANEKAPCKVS